MNYMPIVLQIPDKKSVGGNWVEQRQFKSMGERIESMEINQFGVNTESIVLHHVRWII